MDRYLGHYLKNWIAHRPLPPEGREELLAMAAEQNKRVQKRGHASEKEPEWFSPGQWLGPLTQSRSWSLNLTLNFRLVT